MNRVILRFWNRHPGQRGEVPRLCLRLWRRRMECTAGAGRRALRIIAALIAVFLWGMAAGQALTLSDLHRPTSAFTLPPLPVLNDVAQRLPGWADAVMELKHG